MKKHFLNKVSSVLIVMICVLSAVLSVPHPVKALQDTGNINIQIAPFAEGEELSLYDIGRYISGFQLDPFFKESGVDLSKAKNASELMECANKLLNYIKDFEGPQPVAKARVDSTGTAKFMHINADYKLYMIVQSSDTNKIAISPMIVEMPYYTKISGEYLYNMKIQAKYFDTRGKEKLSAIVLDKICPKGNPLRNAMFTFEQKMYYSNEKMIPDEAETGEDKNGTFYWKRLSKSMATNDNGQIVVEDLPFGVYRFKEYRAPTGFLLDTTPIIAHVDTYGTVKVNEDGVYVIDEGVPEMLIFENEPKPDPCNSDPCNSNPCSNPCESSKPNSEPSCQSCPSVPSDISYPSYPSFPSFPSYPDISYPSTPSETTDPEVTHPSTSYPDISYPDISYPDISYPSSVSDVSYPDISYPDISYPDVSYPDVSYPDISYPDVSYPDVSYPDISYPGVSYPSVSYPQIVPGGKGNSVITGDDTGRYILTAGVVAVSFASVIVLVFAGRKRKKQ